MSRRPQIGAVFHHQPLELQPHADVLLRLWQRRACIMPFSAPRHLHNQLRLDRVGPGAGPARAQTRDPDGVQHR